MRGRGLNMKVAMTVCLSALLGGAGAMHGWQTEPATPAEAKWQVSGTVRDETKPFKNINVSMTGPEYLRTRTDGQGRYSFSGSRPGIYRIRMQKPDDASRARSRTIRVSAGEKVSGVDLIAPKGAVITGNVQDTSGKPVAGLVVVATIRDLEGGFLRLNTVSGAVTNDRGEYRIAYLPQGTYLVSAAPAIRNQLKATRSQAAPIASQPSAYPPETFYPGGRSPGAAAAIEVAAGEERHGVDITMERLPTYCVTARPSLAFSDPGTPFVSEMAVWEWPEGRGQRVGGGKVVDGEALQICGIPQGTYKLSFSSLILKPLQGLGLGVATVDVDKNHVDVGRVELFGYEKMHGRIKVRGAKTDAPFPDGVRLRIRAVDRDLQFFEAALANAGKDGSFELLKLFRESLYRIEVQNLPPRHYVTGVEQGGVDVQKTGAMTGAGPVEVQLAADGPRLTGKVLAEDGESPVPEAAVFLVNRRSGRVHIAESDQAGIYVMDSEIPPGEYSVVAVRDLPEDPRSDPKVAERHLSGAAHVKLAAGDDRMMDLTARSK